MVIPNEPSAISTRPKRSRDLAFRLAGTALIVAIFLGVVGAALLTDAEDTRERPLVPEGVTGRPFAVDLDDAGGGERHSLERSLRLFVPSPERLLQDPELRVEIATFGTSPRLAQAVIHVVGSRCAYQTPPGTRLRNNQALPFLRGPGCSRLDGATGELLLTVSLHSPGRVAVWALLPSVAVDSGGVIYLGPTSPAAAETRPLLRGQYVEHLTETGLRRIDLLAYVWQLDLSPAWIWGLMALAAGLLGIGIWLVLPCRLPTQVGWRPSVLNGLGGFSLAAGLGLTYAVLVPPFHAADEPNHFVGFASFIDRPNLNAEAAHWARIGHFQRIQFNPGERFRPTDIDRLGILWDDDGEPDSTMRGGGGEWLWRSLGPLAQTTPAPRLFLALRLVNVLWFATCLGGVFFALTRWSGIAWPQLLALPLFWIPTLPFFGMHVSNHALLLGAYLVTGAGTLLLVLDNRHSQVGGSLIGAGWTASLLISRAAAPLAPFILFLLGGRLLLGDRQGRLGASLVFWLGLGVPVSVGMYLAPTAYIDTLLIGATTALPAVSSAFVTVLWKHPWLVVPATVMLALLEHALSRLRLRIRWHLHPVFLQIGAAVAAVSTLLLFAGALFFRYPTLGVIEVGTRPDPGQYVADVLRAGLTLFRFGQPDRLTSHTFWGGFGWLETSPPEMLVTALAASSGLALVALLLWIARTGAGRAAVWLALVLLGYAASLAAYALTVATVTPADLHGRYLVGLYICLLLVCWSSLARIVESRAAVGGAPWIPLLCTALAAGVHGVSLVAIVGRYF